MLLVIKLYINTINIKRVHFIATLIISTKGSLQGAWSSESTSVEFWAHYDEGEISITDLGTEVEILVGSVSFVKLDQETFEVCLTINNCSWFNSRQTNKWTGATVVT